MIYREMKMQKVRMRNVGRRATVTLLKMRRMNTSQMKKRKRKRMKMRKRRRVSLRSQ